MNPKPCPNYRLLNKGEIIQEGDEYLSDTRHWSKFGPLAFGQPTSGHECIRRVSISAETGKMLADKLQEFIDALYDGPENCSAIRAEKLSDEATDLLKHYNLEIGAS